MSSHRWTLVVALAAGLGAGVVAVACMGTCGEARQSLKDFCEP